MNIPEKKKIIKNGFIIIRLSLSPIFPYIKKEEPSLVARVYYQRIDVKRAVCGYAESGKGHGIRECAFFNRKNGTFRRYIETPEGKRPVDLTDKGFSEALRMGADAFYCSYWVYDSRDFSTPIGRDLVWIVRAEKGDLKFAKRITKMAVEALSSAGADPLVKYSGDMGFDIVIPLEDIPFEVWLGDLRALDELQEELSEAIVSYIRSRPGVTVEGSNFTFRVKENEKTSLLSELRVKRGLLLAPMSINPETGLVSVPVDPAELDSFTIFDASPSRVKTREWATGRAPNYGLMRYAKAWQPQVASGKSTG